MSHRFGTLALLLILGLVSVITAPPAYTRTASISDRSASDTAPPGESIEFLSSIGGITSQISVSGTLIFISEGTKLSIIDAADPSHPIRRGSIELSGPINHVTISPINDLVVSNGFAYLALGSAGLQIVDVHDPDQPRLRGRYQAPGLVFGSEIEAQAGIVYLAGIFSDNALLQVIDASNPDAPMLRGEFSLGAAAQDMQLVDNLLYVQTSDYQQYLQIIDVSDPSQPQLRGFYGSPNQPLITFRVVGHMIYAIDYDDHLSLLLIDASNPSQPVLRSSYRLLSPVDDLWAEGTTVYLFGDPAQAVQIIDVSNPSQPSLRGTYTSANEIIDLQVFAGRMYLYRYGTIMIADLTLPSEPHIYSHFMLSSYADKLQVVGDLLYMTGHEIGLQIFEIGDPAHPILRGLYVGPDPDQPETFGALYVHGNVAYVTSDRALKLIDVSDPDNPTLIGQYDGVNIFGNLRVVGTRLYGFGFSDDSFSALLFIFDISDLTHPQLLNNYPLPTVHSYDLEIAGNLAYLVGDEGQLVIVDVSNPFKPVTESQIELNYSPNGYFLEVVEGFAYVTGRQLQIVDVHDPSRPVLRSTYAVDIQAQGIAIDGTQLYMVDSFEPRLHIADIAHPFNLRPRATYRLSGGDPWDVAVADDLVFVNTWGWGVRIFRVDPAQFPSSIFIPMLTRPASTAAETAQS